MRIPSLKLSVQNPSSEDARRVTPCVRFFVNTLITFFSLSKVHPPIIAASSEPSEPQGVNCVLHLLAGAFCFSLVGWYQSLLESSEMRNSWAVSETQ